MAYASSGSNRNMRRMRKRGGGEEKETHFRPLHYMVSFSFQPQKVARHCVGITNGMEFKSTKVMKLPKR
jgi:hypothetical protein